MRIITFILIIAIYKVNKKHFFLSQEQNKDITTVIKTGDEDNPHSYGYFMINILYF